MTCGHKDSRVCSRKGMPFERKEFNRHRQNRVNLESEGTADTHYNHVCGYGLPAAGAGVNWLCFSTGCLFLFLDPKCGMVKLIIRRGVSVHLLGFASLCVFI